MDPKVGMFLAHTYLLTNLLTFFFKVIIGLVDSSDSNRVDSMMSGLLVRISDKVLYQ